MRPLQPLLPFLSLFFGIFHVSAIIPDLYKAPDYSLVVKDNIQRYLYAMIVIDDVAESTYHNDETTIRRAVKQIFDVANTYFFQLDIKLVISSIVSAGQQFSSIQKSNEFLQLLRQGRSIPYHNFAVFLQSNARFGTAWRGQLCSLWNGINVEFNTLNPADSGSAIFREFSVLANVSQTQPIENVYNCRCTTNAFKGKRDCLMIPGFKQNCTVQYLFNQLRNQACIPQGPKSLTDVSPSGMSPKPGNVKADPMVATVQILSGVNICGNGIVEKSESCDFGYKRYSYDAKLKKRCVESTCLWKGGSETVVSGNSQRCTCDLYRQITQQYCRRVRCQLDLPNYVIHGILYFITALILLAFCCCFTCGYGKHDASKVYRGSTVIDFDDRPCYKPPPPPVLMAATNPKPSIVVIRPNQAPPPPPPVAPKPIINGSSAFLNQEIPIMRTTCTPAWRKKENPYDRVAV